MKKSLVIGLAAAVVLAIAGIAWATDDDEDDINAAGLAKALSEASVSLDQGLKASESEGKPISGKFEIQDGALQLSVYTMKEDQFSEVVVDHKSGSIKKSEPITDPDDLKEAKEQGEAMAKAKLPLAAAVASAVKANNGSRAVSAVPMLDGGQPVASVTLDQRRRGQEGNRKARLTPAAKRLSESLGRVRIDCTRVVFRIEPLRIRLTKENQHACYDAIGVPFSAVRSARNGGRNGLEEGRSRIRAHRGDKWRGAPLWAPPERSQGHP